MTTFPFIRRGPTLVTPSQTTKRMEEYGMKRGIEPQRIGTDLKLFVLPQNNLLHVKFEVAKR